MTSVLDRAVAAVEDGFAECVKSEFTALFTNCAGGEPLATALEKSTKGLGKLKAARVGALALISDIFKDDPA